MDLKPSMDLKPEMDQKLGVDMKPEMDLKPRSFGRPLWIGCLYLGCFFLCGSFSPDHAATAQQIMPRILLGDQTDDYEAVGIVGSVGRGGFCSGTLITDSHVLTAAHCAEFIEAANRGTFELSGRVYGTINVFIHPDYNSRTLANDIAILQLDEPVTDVLPSQIFRGVPFVGELLFIVGFGATGTADGGSDGSFGTKRVGITTIDEVTSTLITWIFDDPTEANTAPGDSGGPGYLDIDGEWFLASITSGGTEPGAILGDVAFNTRVDAFADWIDLTVAMSTTPDPDPTDDPTGDPGSGGGCDGFWSDLFANDEVRPFPFLQFLIDLLSNLLDRLNEIQTQLDSNEAAVVVEPVSTSESANSKVTTPQRVTSPLVEYRFPDLPPIAGPSVNHQRITATHDEESRAVLPGVTRSADELPPRGATKLEIRRWILHHPGSRSRLTNR